MMNHELLDPKINEIRQLILEAKNAEYTAQKLTDAYVHYIIIANAGGIAACLGVANKIINKNIGYPEFVGPMWLFLFGLIFGGFLVSLRRAHSAHLAEQSLLKAINLLNVYGQTIPDQKSVFSEIERKSINYLIVSINLVGIISQILFYLEQSGV